MKKHILFSTLITLLVLVLVTCKKDTETPSGSNKIEIGQTHADSVSYYYSQVSTTITDLNGSNIKEHGHCWATTKEPTIEDYKTQLGKLTQAATFSSELNDLEDHTNYYVRYYLTIDNGTIYGEDMVFSTLKAGAPKVETETVLNITLNSADCQGIVLADSGAIVTTRGICWHTEEDFTIDNCTDSTVNGSGLGSFSAQISDLTEGSNYYVKAYAINKKGISYGEVKNFTTVAISKPSLSTLSVEDITINQALINAEVLNNGLGTISARGVCWHTEADFDIENNTGINNESGDLGEFTSTISGLTENTHYYTKAFATNEKGTAYGDVLEFTTLPISISELSTKEISGITVNSADAGGIITSDGYSTITARGVVWSTTENPTLENNEGITEDGDGLGEFTSNITNLDDGTAYFVRAYAINEIGTAYGDQKSFQTIGIGFPVLTTKDVTDITANSAQSGGNITDAGNGNITARGICWNTTGNPTLEDNINYTTNGTGTGEFTAQLNSLNEGVQYYVAAYATNEEGTTYGGVKSFTTTDLSTPTVSTANASNITINSATAGGEVTDDGNLTVIQRGVCWHTNSNPSMDNNLGYTTDGTGTGSFVSSINGLNQGTTYYFRAYAINAEGTAYGTIKEFTTLNLELPTVSTNDISNIGTTYATGGGHISNDGNSTVTARGVCWNTTGSPTLGNSIGYTSDGSGTGSFTSNITGLNEGTTYYVAAYASNSEGTAYGSIKSFSTLEITLPTVTTTTPTDITNNSAISGGNVTNDGNSIVTARGVCWNTTGSPTLSNNDGYTTNGSGTGVFTSSLTGLDENTIYYVAAYATNSEGTSYGEMFSFITLTLPTVITTTPSEITANSAISGGEVLNEGNGNVTARGVCWNTTGNPTLSNNIGFTEDGNGLGSFMSNIIGLNDNTTYYVVAYATNSVGTEYGNLLSFTTIIADFTDPRDGQVYPVVQIGEQIWFAENLNYEMGNSWCYNNSTNSCEIYGRLYDWETAMDACPAGWHLPSVTEWVILSDFLGGSSIAGGKMKEIGTEHWNSPNTGATNSSSFTALPGGFKHYSSGYLYFGNVGMFWSSTENGTGGKSWYKAFNYESAGMGTGSSVHPSGLSVRCLKN